MTHEILRTVRLTLRPARSDDAPAIFENYAADPEVTRYLQWQPQHDVEGVRAFLSACELKRDAGTELSWVIAETPLGAAIGMITLHLEFSVTQFVSSALAAGVSVRPDQRWKIGFKVSMGLLVTRYGSARPSLRRQVPGTALSTEVRCWIAIAHLL